MNKCLVSYRRWLWAAVLVVGSGLAWALGAWLRGRFDPLQGAEQACAAGQWERALPIVSRHLHAHPDDQRARLIAARAFHHLGYWEEAERHYRRLHDLPLDDMRLRAEGLVLSQQWSDAIAAYQSLLQRVPDDFAAQQRLTALLIHEQVNWEGAFYWAERMTAGPPAQQTVGRFFLGNLYHMLHRPADAIAHFQRALELEPNLEEAGVPLNLVREDLAEDLLRLGRAAEAEAHLARQPTGARGWNWYWLSSAARLAQGDARGFEDLRRKAFELEPASADTRRRIEPAAYIGARRCGECHLDIIERQVFSHHANTLRPASHEQFRQIPEGPYPDPAEPSVWHHYRLDNGGDSKERVAWIVQQGSDTAEARVEYVVGSGAHGISLVGHDAGMQSLEVRLSYYGSDTGWALTPGHPASKSPRLESYLGRSLNVKEFQGCFNCHTTGPWPGRDPGRGERLDAGVSCESCHGPGSNHVRAEHSKSVDRAIVHPGRLAAEELTNMCGQCHRASAVVVPGANRPALSQPETFSNSRCFSAAAGKLTCITCHDPHENVQHDAGHYEQQCLNCHQGAGSAPCPVNPRQDCVQCHMPIVPGLPHTRLTDHSIRARPAR